MRLYTEELRWANLRFGFKNRTPFLGGFGLLRYVKLELNLALGVGVLTSLIALGIGIFFFIVSGWQLIPLVVVAGLILVLYTPVILKTTWP